MTKQKHFYLIRGLIREARHWGDIPELLRTSCPGCKVTTIDIPGAGIYSASPSRLSLKKMVEEMRRVYRETAQADEEKVLVAISLGGMIAAQWLKLQEDDFHKVVMINTSFGGMSPIFDRLRPGALGFLLKVPLMKGREKEARILRLVSNHNQVFDKTLDLWEKIQQENPVTLYNTIKQLAAAAIFRVGDFKPSIPVLILASVSDRMVSVNCSRVIAKSWGASIVEHTTAGHDLSADDPKWIVKEILKFTV